MDPRAGEQLTSRIVAFLRTRRALLVLDNCEHVLAHAARLVARLLEGTPATTILATSRERLRVPGEQRLPVEPLPVTRAGGLTGAAVELYAQRARLASPAFELAPVAAQVAELCAALGGLPLAIEIAAARTATRGAGDIVSQLRRHDGELRGERERSSRHQSLHAVVAWSCDLLSPTHREVFENMAVFAGGWNLAAARALAGAPASRDQVAGAPGRPGRTGTRNRRYDRTGDPVGPARAGPRLRRLPAPQPGRRHGDPRPPRGILPSKPGHLLVLGEAFRRVIQSLGAHAEGITRVGGRIRLIQR